MYARGEVDIFKERTYDCIEITCVRSLELMLLLGNKSE